MSPPEKEKQKPDQARPPTVDSIVDSIGRFLTAGDDCADVLMLWANGRGGTGSLRAEVPGRPGTLV
jgi:hypothetical protein